MDLKYPGPVSLFRTDRPATKVENQEESQAQAEVSFTTFILGLLDSKSPQAPLFGSQQKKDETTH
jgi:hypothetical protein